MKLVRQPHEVFLTQCLIIPFLSQQSVFVTEKMDTLGQGTVRTKDHDTFKIGQLLVVWVNSQFLPEKWIRSCIDTPINATTSKNQVAIVK